jgi:hypothetical protein
MLHSTSRRFRAHRRPRARFNEGDAPFRDVRPEQLSVSPTIRLNEVVRERLPQASESAASPRHPHAQAAAEQNNVHPRALCPRPGSGHRIGFRTSQAGCQPTIPPAGSGRSAETRLAHISTCFHGRASRAARRFDSSRPPRSEPSDRKPKAASPPARHATIVVQPRDEALLRFEALGE